MNITVFACRRRGGVSFALNQPYHYGLVIALCVFVLGASAGMGYRAGQAHEREASAAAWQEVMRAQEQESWQVDEIKRAEIAALSQRLAELRGRLSALDALGRKLVDVADLDLGELDFTTGEQAGGPLLSLGGEIRREAPPAPVADFGTLHREADRIAGKLGDRRRKMGVIEGFLVERELRTETTPAGWPIDSGWISSSFGHRADPISGQRAFHGGTDFATYAGEPVYAVAGGVVTFSGRRAAYGYLVEINHGNGYTTRYAHNKENLVRVGEVVRAGDQIAKVGSTGRSTGPHVHLEVRKHGKPKNPAPFASAER